MSSKNFLVRLRLGKWNEKFCNNIHNIYMKINFIVSTIPGEYKYLHIVASLFYFYTSFHFDDHVIALLLLNIPLKESYREVLQYLMQILQTPAVGNFLIIFIFISSHSGIAHEALFTTINGSNKTI